MAAGRTVTQVVHQRVLLALHPTGTLLTYPEMTFELWKEPKVIVAGILLFVIARAVYKKNQVGRPPVVSYAVPWVGSAIDLGKSPDAFFKRAMYVEWLFTRLEAGDKLPVFSAKYGDTFTVKAFGRVITYVTSPQVKEAEHFLPRTTLADLYKLIAEVYKNPQVRMHPLVLTYSTR